MAGRITIEMLNNLVKRLNTFAPTDRAYSLTRGYNGFCLMQDNGDGSGFRNVFNYGHLPASDAYHRIEAYINGYQDGLLAAIPTIK